MGQIAKNIGIIGGGQLAWMMAPEAKKLGLRLMIQTPNQSDPAAVMAEHVVLGTVADAMATAILSKQCDVICLKN